MIVVPRFNNLFAICLESASLSNNGRSSSISDKTPLISLISVRNRVLSSGSVIDYLLCQPTDKGYVIEKSYKLSEEKNLFKSKRNISFWILSFS